MIPEFKPPMFRQGTARPVVSSPLDNDGHARPRQALGSLANALEIIGSVRRRNVRRRRELQGEAGTSFRKAWWAKAGKCRQAWLGLELVSVRGRLSLSRNALVLICDYRSRRSHRLLKRRRFAPSVFLHEAMFDMTTCRVSSSS